MRAGDHHDGMFFYGLSATGARDDAASARGLLAMNHEALTDHFLHEHGSSARPRPAAESDKEIAAHGISVVEVARSGDTWATKQDSAFNRRITPLTPMQINGVARGNALMKTRFSTTGNDCRGTINNCGTGFAGTMLVLGGAPGMPGAIRLAAEGALRSGAGLVKVVTCAEHQAALLAGRPELMCQEAPTMASDHAALAAWASIRVLGPGLGLGAWSRSLWQQQLALPEPLVLDADGLTLLAEFPCRREDWILTPHPGEAARLLGCSVAEVERDRLHAVRQLQQRYGGVILLKGAGTLIADANCVWICQEGNPGMASGGMGDLLSGIIGALWGQGLPQAVAAWVGACVHGEAGDLAAESGERGMLASDLLPFIRRLVNPAESSG